MSDSLVTDQIRITKYYGGYRFGRCFDFAIATGEKVTLREPELIDLIKVLAAIRAIEDMT